MRGLLPAFPGVEVYTRLSDVLDAEEGSTVIWIPDAREADRANLERPVFADRGLKVVLFSPKKVSDHYARRAPDLFSWITRYVECPVVAFAPAVAGLKGGAGCAEALGIRWTGGDLDSAFAQAFPGEKMVRLSSDMAYDEMVKASAEVGDWIVWQEVDGPYRLRRVTWSAAEARRKGRVILEGPTVGAPGYWPVSGRAAAAEEAREQLRKAGAERPGRLAALLELEPAALKLAAAALRAGCIQGELEMEALESGDGGAAAAKVAVEKRVAHERPTPPILRAGVGALWVPEDEVRARLLGPAEERGSWAALAEMALDAGDPRIGLFWAQRSLTDDADTADARVAVSRALFGRGLTRDAVKLLEWAVNDTDAREDPTRLKARVTLATFRARLRASVPEDEEVLKGAVERQRRENPRSAGLVRLLQTVGLMESRSGNPEGAFGTLEEALRIEAALPSAERRKVLPSRYGLAMIQKDRGALREAESMALHALAEACNRFGEQHPNVATCLQGLGTVLSAKGDLRGAVGCLQRALSLKRRLYGDEHPSTAAAFHEVGKVWTAMGDFEQGERMLRAAMEYRLSSFGDRSPELAETLDALGRLKELQGQHSEAEDLLRRATEIRAAALGSAHPETLESVHGLSEVSAERHAQMRTAFGLGHPFTRDVEAALGGVGGGRSRDRGGAPHRSPGK